MEINVTRFIEDADPYNYSASAAELGDCAGEITWRNAVEAADEFPLLDTDEKREAMRGHAKGFGAWSEDEIAAWSDAELNALFLQMLSGDMREMPETDEGEIDWEAAEPLQREGNIPSNLFKGVDGQIYYYLGE